MIFFYICASIRNGQEMLCLPYAGLFPSPLQYPQRRVDIIGMATHPYISRSKHSRINL